MVSECRFAAGREKPPVNEEAGQNVSPSPGELDGPPGGEHTYPPALGADTDAVLRGDLGLSEAEIAGLRAAKAVA